jgi:very-short-patch-repair endonuclease
LPADRVHLHYIPVTSVPRTLIDLSNVLSAQQLAAAIREAEYRNLLNLSALTRAIDQSGPKPGVRNLQHALELRGLGSAGTRSNLEDRMLDLISTAGLPSPRVNVPIKSGGKRIEVDLVWSEAHLCVEVDGPGHQRPAARLEDAYRDKSLTSAGFTVIRFTKVDITLHPDRVLHILRTHLAANS